MWQQAWADIKGFRERKWKRCCKRKWEKKGNPSRYKRESTGKTVRQRGEVTVWLITDVELERENEEETVSQVGVTKGLVLSPDQQLVFFTPANINCFALIKVNWKKSKSFKKKISLYCSLCPPHHFWYSYPSYLHLTQHTKLYVQTHIFFFFFASPIIFSMKQEVQYTVLN